MELLQHYSSFGRWCQTVTGLLDRAESATERENTESAEPRRTARQLPPSEVAEIVAGYQAGASIYTLARQFKIHRATVANHLCTAGVTMRHQSLNEDQINEAVQLYEEGLSLAKVGKKLGFGANTVRDVLLRRGVRMRDPHWRPR